MDAKSPSFSAYDFLGYLVPGAAAVLAIDAAVAFHTSEIVFDYNSLLARYSSKEIGLALPFVIISYLLGHFLSFLSSVSLERYAIWRYGHPSKYLLNMETGGFYAVQGSNPSLSWALRTVMWIFLFPVSILDLIFGSMLKLRANYVTPLDPLLRAAVWNSLNVIVERCGVDDARKHGKPKDHEFWKLAVHYALEKAPNHVSSLRNYVVLYGFLRTTALVFVLVFWVAAAHLLFTGASAALTASILGIGAAICFAAFMSFMKFFQRYHEEALFAVTIAISK